MPLSCEQCVSFIKKINPSHQHWIENSFIKINGKLHFAYENYNPCKALKSYSPEVIIVAGDGAIELEENRRCWDILKRTMTELGIVGHEGYHEPSEGLTWLASFIAYMSRTHSQDNSLEQIKSRIIGELSKYSSKPRKMYCVSCDKDFTVENSKKILVLTTNWELGLFKHFENIVQLHGRCDRPQYAVLPSENVTKFMPRTLEELQNLEGQLFPGDFLQKCIHNAKYLVFWGSGINDYDSHLWHFIHGFGDKKPNRLAKLEISVAAENLAGYEKKLPQIRKYFPRVPITNCVCKMIPH